MTKHEEKTGVSRIPSNALLGGASADAPMFDFDLIYVARDKDPYYITRWDLAKPISVRAHTLEHAFDSAKAALGEPGRYQRWLFEVRKMTDSRIADSLRVPPNAGIERREHGADENRQTVGASAPMTGSAASEDGNADTA